MARAAEFRFDHRLEDPSLLWLTWRGSGLVRYEPPRVGTTETLPAIDLFEPLRTL